jgi:hypothetical protein
VHPTVETGSAGERRGGRERHRHRRRHRHPFPTVENMIRGVHAFWDRGHGARREVFAAGWLRAGVGVFARCVRSGGVLTEVAEACSEHADAFFQSVEGDAADAGSEG